MNLVISMQCQEPYIEKPYSSAHRNKEALPGQACVLHSLVASPTQSLPPLAGAGLLHVLVSVPPPQLLDHAPKPDHPPSSVLSPVMPSATRFTSIGNATNRNIRPYRQQQTTSTSNALNHKKDITAHSHQQAVLAQACVLHAPIASPSQCLPPFAGTGLLHVRL